MKDLTRITLTVPKPLRDWMESEAAKNFQSVSGFTAAQLNDAKQRTEKARKKKS